MARWLPILALGLIACAPSRRRWQPRDTPADGSTAFAVVALSTPLHTAPSRRAPALRLSDAAPRPWAPDRLAVFRLQRERGGWAELESPGPLDQTHCAGEARPLRPFALRLFAPASALVPVTSREVVQTFSDDTSIALARGVPVLPLPGTRLHRARLGSMSVVVRLGDADTNTRYLPSLPREPDGPAIGYVRPDVVSSGAAILGQTGRLTASSPHLALPYYDVFARGPAERIVELWPRCAILRVRVPATALDQSLDLLGTLGRREAEPVAVVEPGAPVYWGDGREAGTTVERASLEREVDPRHDRRCFALGPRPADGEEAAVTLCFDPEDLRSPGAGLGHRLASP